MSRPCGFWTGTIPVSQFRSINQVPLKILPSSFDRPELDEAFQSSGGLAYRTPEFADAFARYSQVIKGNISLQDEANFILKALPHYDSNGDGFVTWTGELETVPNPIVRNQIKSLWGVFENSKECPADQFPYSPPSSPTSPKASGKEILIRRPEEIAEAQREFHQKELWIRSGIVLVLALVFHRPLLWVAKIISWPVWKPIQYICRKMSRRPEPQPEGTLPNPRPPATVQTLPVRTNTSGKPDGNSHPTKKAKG